MAIRPYRIQVSTKTQAGVRTVLADELMRGQMNMSLTDKVDKFECVINNKQGRFSTSATFKEDNDILAFATNTDLNDCLLYYQFGDRLEDDDNNDTKTSDRSGNENHSTGNTGLLAAKVNGQIGKALQNKTVITPSLGAMNEITLVALVKFDTISAQNIFQKGTNVLDINSSGQIRLNLTDAGVTIIGTLGNAIQAGVWTWIIGTYDKVSTNAFLYKAAFNSSSFTQIASGTGNGSAISSAAWTLGTTSGVCDDLRIYNKAKSQGQANQIAKETFPRSELIFGGYIEKKIISRKKKSNRNSKITLHSIGWGVNLLERLVVDSFPNQSLKTTVKNLTDKWLEGLGFSLVLNGGDTNLPDQKFNYEPLIEILKRLGKYDLTGDLDIIVTPDKKIKMFPRGTQKTGIIFQTGATGNIEELEYGIDVSRFLDRAIMRGAIRTFPDVTYADISDSSKTLATKWLAAKFMPVNPKLRGFRLAVEAIGSPPEDLVVQLYIGGTTTPSGTKMGEWKIPRDRIAATLDADSDKHPLVDFGIDELIFADTNATYWVVLRRTGDASNTYRWKGVASGSNAADSTDGTTWSAITYTFGFKTLTQSQVIVVAQNPATVGAAVAGGRLREDIFANPIIISPEVLRKEGEKMIERFNTRFEEVEITARPPDGKWILPGDEVTVIDTDSGIQAPKNTYVVHEINWAFREGFKTWTYQLTMTRSEESESLEDLLAQHQRNLWEEKRARLGISENFETDFPFTFNNALTLSTSTDFDQVKDGTWFVIDEDLRTGTINGGVTFVDGINSWKAGNFNGTSGYIEFPDVNALDFAASDSFSVSLWFKTTESGSLKVLVSKQSGASPAIGYSVFKDTDNKIKFYISDGTNTTTAESNSTLNDGILHYLLAVRNTSTDKLLLYIDGILQSSQPTDSTTGTLANAVVFRIGNRGDNAAYWSGDIDDVAVYRSALSSTNADDLAHQHDIPGAILFVDFDEGFFNPSTPTVLNVATQIGRFTA